MKIVKELKRNVLKIPNFIFQKTDSKILLKSGSIQSHSRLPSETNIEKLFPGECDLKHGVYECFKNKQMIKMDIICNKCLKLDFSYGIATLYFNEPDIVEIYIEEKEKCFQVQEQIKSEELFETFFNQSTIGLTIIDGNLTILKTNKTFEELFGYSSRELNKQVLLKILHKDYKISLFRDIIKLYKRNIISFNTENKFITKSGDETWINLKVSGVYKNQTFLYAIGMWEDITKRKQIENMLIQSQERFKDVLEEQTELICRWNKHGVFTFANTAFLTFHKLKYEQVIGKHYNDFLTPGLILLKRVFSFIQSAENLEVKLKIDSRDVWINWRVMKILFHDDIEYQAVGRNITELKQNQNNLKESNSELERSVELRTSELVKANRRLAKEIVERAQTEQEKSRIQEQFLQAQKMDALGVMAGGIAHDFNNLLNVINGYTQLLMWNFEKDEESLSDLKEIQEASFKAARLTHQLLVFSRQEKLKKIPLYLNSNITETLKMAGRIIGEDIKLIPVLDKNIHRILADPGNLEQIIINLILNARDAMPDGGDIEIKTYNKTITGDYSKLQSYTNPGEYVCLEISDHGLGMDEETQKRIFEPFFTTKPRGKGTGLGLSVVYGIVKEHSGFIEVESKENQGTVLRLYFEAINIKDSEVAEEQKKIYDYRGNNESILLIEDEKPLLKINTRVLSQNGYMVFPAENGSRAKSLFYENKMKFDLIISDVVLPDINGLSLIDDFLKECPEIKVLLSSGYTGDKARFNSIQEKDINFIQKPYNLIQLLQCIRQILDDN